MRLQLLVCCLFSPLIHPSQRQPRESYHITKNKEKKETHYGFRLQYYVPTLQRSLQLHVLFKIIPMFSDWVISQVLLYYLNYMCARRYMLVTADIHKSWRLQIFVDLELQAVVYHLMWFQGVELGVSTNREILVGCHWRTMSLTEETSLYPQVIFITRRYFSCLSVCTNAYLFSLHFFLYLNNKRCRGEFKQLSIE